MAARKVRGDIAEEIVQDIFVQLWRNRAQLDIDHLDAYLHRAVRFGVLRHYRKEGVAQRYLDHAMPFPTETTLSDAEYALQVEELNARVQDILATLPDKTQTVFHLSRQEGLPVREIAAQLSLSEKAIEYHITQALRALRTQLEPFVVLWIWCLC